MHLKRDRTAHTRVFAIVIRQNNCKSLIRDLLMYPHLAKNIENKIVSKPAQEQFAERAFRMRIHSRSSFSFPFASAFFLFIFSMLAVVSDFFYFSICLPFCLWALFRSLCPFTAPECIKFINCDHFCLIITHAKFN